MMNTEPTAVHATRPTIEEAEKVLEERCDEFEEQNPMAVQGTGGCEDSQLGVHCVQYYD